MEKKNMINKTNGRKTIAYVIIALLLTGFVVGGTIPLNVGSAEKTVNSKNLEDTEIVAEEFKYKGEDEGSILNIQEELAKIDREETKKRQEEFKKQLAEQKQEEERLAEEARVKAEEEARVKAEEEARIVAEQKAQQQAPKQVTQAPKQNKQAPKQNTQAPKQKTPAPQPSTKPQEPKVDTQQPESDPGYPVDEYESKEHWERLTGDPDWMEDELHYYGYTQNGVEGHQW